MSVAATVLFGIPQQEIASLICDHVAKCQKVEIVSGFVTVEGMNLIRPAFEADPSKLKTLVVGAGTYRGYEAIDQLIAIGVPQANLRVHLGHTRPTGPSAKHRFYRYHPMLHSKVYLMDHSDGTSSAIIGSHNVTGFALAGLNGEASILLEGPSSSSEFQKIRQHIKLAAIQSAFYSPDMKEAFSWWTHQFVEGLSDKTNDIPRDAESKKTVVILAETSDVPVQDDIIYFELPAALGKVSSLNAEVHVFLFENLPKSPWLGLKSLHKAIGSCWCRTMGLEMEQGGVELRADWQIDDNCRPLLRRTAKPFRPTPTPDRQQVRVQVYKKVFTSYDYLFNTGKKKWVPVFAEEDDRYTVDGFDDSESYEQGVLSRQVQVPQVHSHLFMSLNLRPNAEHLPWTLVSDLTPEDGPIDNAYQRALLEFSPEQGSYVMLSLRRREQTASSGTRDVES